MTRGPLALRVIGYFFVLLGISAIVNTVVALLDQRIHLDFNLVGLWIGHGLLRWDPGSVRRARTFLLAAIIVSSMLAFYALFVASNGGAAEVRYFGRTIGETSAFVVVPVALGMAAVAGWQRRVLARYETRPGLRALEKPGGE